MLYEKRLHMEAKAFAVGVRIEHPQEMITRSQYGQDVPQELKAASYRLAATLENGRGVYSFCMCPGGWVVNASSEQGYLAVNGMSLYARDSGNANSAIVVTVNPADYLSYNLEELPQALSGIAFQRYLEKSAFQSAGGRVPVQRFGDFCAGRTGGAGTSLHALKEPFPLQTSGAFSRNLSAIPWRLGFGPWTGRFPDSPWRERFSPPWKAGRPRPCGL